MFEIEPFLRVAREQGTAKTSFENTDSENNSVALQSLFVSMELEIKE